MTLLVVSLLAAVSLCGALPSPCYNNGVGGCYQLVGGRTWENAGLNCVQLGGNSQLAVIDSSVKNDALQNFLWNMWRLKNLPVTGHDVFTAGQRLTLGNCSSPFYWKPSAQSQTPVTGYTNWEDGEPDCQDTVYTTNGYVTVSGASCLKAIIGSTLTWYDSDCSSGMIGVCETFS